MSTVGDAVLLGETYLDMDFVRYSGSSLSRILYLNRAIFAWVLSATAFLAQIVFFPISVALSLPNLYQWVLDHFDPRWAALHDATSYEEWEAAGASLDQKYNLDTWRNTPDSEHYAWVLIRDRLGAFEKALETGEIRNLMNLLQSGLTRNLGNIANPALYNACFVGTKHLIEHYTLQLCETISDLANLPSRRSPVSTPSSQADSGLHLISRAFAVALARGSDSRFLSATHDKREFFSRLRHTYGRTALVFQGGSVFGLCHLGVAKALFRSGLLPRIVVGTGTGALMAALIGIHTDEELPGVLDGTSINLSAFDSGTNGKSSEGVTPSKVAPGRQRQRNLWTRLHTIKRRLMRFWTVGYFLDVKVLERCVLDNGGDVTFGEAYQRTGRHLSITVVPDKAGAVPTVFNHISTPHVVIWTAAVASNATEDRFYGRRQTKILCKRGGQITPYRSAEQIQFRHWSYGTYGSSGQHYPLAEVSRHFQANHFIVSQARPYLVPFVRPSVHGPSAASLRLGRLAAIKEALAAMLALTARYQAEALLRLGLLSASVRRLFLDEKIGAPHLTLVPDVRAQDFVKLLDSPNPEALSEWILMGERSVWPAVAALKIRCSVELQLEQTCESL